MPEVPNLAGGRVLSPDAAVRMRLELVPVGSIDLDDTDHGIGWAAGTLRVGNMAAGEAWLIPISRQALLDLTHNAAQLLARTDPSEPAAAETNGGN